MKKKIFFLVTGFEKVLKRSLILAREVHKNEISPFFFLCSFAKQFLNARPRPKELRFELFCY